MSAPHPFRPGHRGAAALFVVLSLAGAAPAGAQDDGAAWVALEPDREIAYARSAAPAEVSADATVWVLGRDGYGVAVEGTNGNHCFVARSLPQSLEPICYDAEAARTVMQWEFAHFALRTSGPDREAVDRALAEKIATGELDTPARPAMSWMMSSAQRLFDPASGRAAGNWQPHIMLYVPDLSEEDIGIPGALPAVQVADSGTPRAHLVVVTPDFVDPAPPFTPGEAGQPAPPFTPGGARPPA